MDPLTLLAAAKVSYEALKAGIAVGKELQGMAADMGSLFDSVAAITRVAADPKGSLMAGKTAQQVAMEAYAAKAEADQMMEELKNHFIGEFGIAAWDQVLAATTQIKKDQTDVKPLGGGALVAESLGVRYGSVQRNLAVFEPPAHAGVGNLVRCIAPAELRKKHGFLG